MTTRNRPRRPASSSSAAQPVRLVLAEEAVGHEGRRGARGRDADQRHLAAHPQIGESVAIGRRPSGRRRVIQAAQARQTLSKAPGT